MKKLFHFDYDTQMDILDIAKKYESAGYECVMVGGAVRDMLLKREVNDIDFATNAPLEVTRKLFEGKIAETGTDYGTLTIVLGPEQTYEVTRYRKDVETNGRGCVIEFADTLKEDVMRRDFTINALAYNPLEDVIIDYVDGQEHLKKGVLRFVGDCSERVREDNLRGIRYYRFLHQLKHFGFSIKEHQAEFNCISELIRWNYDVKNISFERVYQELSKMFKVDYDVEDIIVQRLSELKILSKVIDDTEHKGILKSCFRHHSFLPLAIEYMNTHNSIQGSALTVNMGKRAKLFQEFHQRKVESEMVKDLLEMASRFGNEFTEALYFVHHMSDIYTENEAFEFRKILREIDENSEPYKVSHLNINGTHLQKLGYKGKEVGDAFNKMLAHVKKHPTTTFTQNYWR